MSWKIFLIVSVCYLSLPALAQATVQISPSFGNQLSDEGDAISKPIEIVGNAIGTVVYGAAGLPDGLSVNPATGLVSGMLNFNAASGSPWSFSVSATDDDGGDVENAIWAVNDVPTVNVLFGDGFEGLSEGSICTETEQCARGLLCCYPCGIEGCENYRCTVPMEDICPLYP